ncbi:hypothetical protein FRC08_015100, partial [Ceratobasidium sp. 394]
IRGGLAPRCYSQPRPSPYPIAFHVCALAVTPCRQRDVQEWNTTISTSSPRSNNDSTTG